MFEIGQQQLLVLLLMMQPERDDVQDLNRKITVSQQREHAFVDASTVRQYLLDSRPRQEATMRAAVHRANSVVVRVEEIPELLVVELVIPHGVLQNKLLE